MSEKTLEEKRKLIRNAGFELKTLFFSSYRISCKYNHVFSIIETELEQNKIICPICERDILLFDAIKKKFEENNFEIIRSDYNNITIRCQRGHEKKLSVSTVGQLRFTCPDCVETDKYIKNFKKKIKKLGYTFISHENNFITIECSIHHIFKYNLIEDYLHKPECPKCDNIYKYRINKLW